MTKNLLYFDTTEEIKTVLNENDKLTTTPPTVALDKEKEKVYYNPYIMKSKEVIFFETYLNQPLGYYSSYSINGVYYFYNNDNKKIYALQLNENLNNVTGQTSDNFEENLFEKKYWRKATTEEMFKIREIIPESLNKEVKNIMAIFDDKTNTYHLEGINLIKHNIKIHVNNKNEQEQHHNGIVDINVKNAGVLVSSNDDVCTYDLIYHEEEHIGKLDMKNFRIEKKENDPTIPYCYVYIYDPKE